MRQKKKKLLLRIQELEEEIKNEKSTASVKDNLINNCESWKIKLEEELNKEKSKSTKLELKLEELLKSTSELEKQIADLQSINFAYIEENKSYKIAIDSYKIFLGEIEIKVREYYQEFERGGYRKKKSLSDELNKIGKRNSFPFFSSPPLITSSPSSPSSPKDDYIRNREKYRKLSEVSDIDYLNEEINQIENKILRLITNLVEKEYNLNLSLFTDLREKIKSKETRIKELEDTLSAVSAVVSDDETIEQEMKTKRADSISKTLPASIEELGKHQKNFDDILEESGEFYQKQKNELETLKKLYSEEKRKRELAEREVKSLQGNTNFKQKVPIIILFLLLVISLIVLFVKGKKTKREREQK